AHACLWLESAGQPRPVLVLDQAKAIADHLTEWAEGDPASWFRLVIAEHGGRYAIPILPRLHRSLTPLPFARPVAWASPRPPPPSISLAPWRCLPPAPGRMRFCPSVPRSTSSPRRITSTRSSATASRAG